MEGNQRGQEPEVAVRQLRGESKEKSCAECRWVINRGWFLYCKAYDKPTSGEVNGCHSYEK